MRLSIVLLSLSMSMLGVGAAWVAYIVAGILSPDVTTYVEFRAADPIVRRGEVVSLIAKYRKHRDCGGTSAIALDDAAPTDGPRIVRTTPLGDRPPGEWTVTRKIAVPIDVALGPATIQETLVYYCGWRSQILRSPVVRIDVLE